MQRRIFLAGRPRGSDRDLPPPAPMQVAGRGAGGGAHVRPRVSHWGFLEHLWKTSSSSVRRWLRTLSKVVNAHNSYSKKRGSIKYLNINMQEGDGKQPQRFHRLLNPRGCRVFCKRARLIWQLIAPCTGASTLACSQQCRVPSNTTKHASVTSLTLLWAVPVCWVWRCH